MLHSNMTQWSITLHTQALLGRGGLAEVHLAVADGRPVAVKRLKPGLVAMHAEMIRDEARVGSLLRHPSIAQTLAFGEGEGGPFVVMELVRGKSLRALMRGLRAVATPRWRSALAAYVMAHVLDALQHAHERGVIHCDVSPENVLVTYDGEVKLIDFGIAQIAEERSASIRGKSSYMPPEQSVGARLDARADVFASGVVLWELLTGSRLYTGGGDVAAELEGIVAHAVALDRDHRYGSAAEMRDRLWSYLLGFPRAPTQLELARLVCGLFPADRLRSQQIVERVVADACPSIPGASPVTRSYDDAREIRVA
jgi:serine/threonine-protein kinase